MPKLSQLAQTNALANDDQLLVTSGGQTRRIAFSAAFAAHGAKLDEFDQALTDKQSEAQEIVNGMRQDRVAQNDQVNALINSALSNYNVINLFRYSGGFIETTPETNYNISQSGAFNPAGFVNHSGSSGLVDGGKFINNNNQNGGTSGDINSDVQSLLAAMGRTGNSARYGREFSILKTVAGSVGAGVVRDGVTYRTSFQLAFQAVSGFFNNTMMFWFKSSQDSILPAGVFIDGVESADESVVTGGQWHHVAYKNDTVIGYRNPAILHCQSGADVFLALPVLTSGHRLGLVHTAPVVSII